MSSAVAGHFVECAHISAKRIKISEPSQGVHELHGPHSDALGHNKTRPKAGVRASTRSTEHDDRGGMEALGSQLGTKLPFKNSRRHILLIDDLHRHHEGIEISDSGRRRMDISAKRSIHPGSRIGVKQNPS
jgi:hypothetical protein